MAACLGHQPSARPRPTDADALPVEGCTHGVRAAPVADSSREIFASSPIPVPGPGQGIHPQRTVVVHLVRRDTHRFSASVHHRLDSAWSSDRVSNHLRQRATRRDVIAEHPVSRATPSSLAGRLDHDRRSPWRQRAGRIAWAVLFASIVACGCLLVYVLHGTLARSPGGPLSMQTPARADSRVDSI
jgi:hypothetical protein